MQLADALAQSAPPERTTPPVNLPSGWEPGVRWSAKEAAGTITTGDLEREPDAALWAEIIKDWQFDPNVMEIIDGSIELIGWDSPIKGTDRSQRLRRYKAKFRQRTNRGDRVDVDALCAMVEKRKARKLPTIGSPERAFVAILADWQVGKSDMNGGTEGTVDRICDSMDRVVARLRDLRRLGAGVDVVYLVGLGDLVEQCSGHYASQTYTTDLNRREQMRVVRRLLLQFVDALCADHAVVLTGVAGNHGENRNAAGKAYTTVDDNDDLAVIEQVAEVLAANPARYGSVSTFLPTELSMCVDVAGVPIGFSHGHQAGNSGSPGAKIEKWWTGQVMGMQPVADARILVTGHYHHLLLSEATGRTHMQAPAMDPGSAWFTSSTGQSSPAGMLTFVAGAGCGPRGWQGLEVL